jgi:ADP-ribose pyrophosphatase YjhB (NUDIX family)
VRHIVAGVLRRGDEIVLVQQQGPGDPDPFWAIPGGTVEGNELLIDALIREVWEETGLAVLDSGPLAYVAQMHNPVRAVLSPGEIPGPEEVATTFVFDVSAWTGEIGGADPDGLVMHAQFVAIAEAIARLEQSPFRIMREPIVAYLRGQAAPGSVWLYRRRAGGDELVRVSAGSSRESGRNPGRD